MSKVYTNFSRTKKIKMEWQTAKGINVSGEEVGAFFENELTQN